MSENQVDKLAALAAGTTLDMMHCVATAVIREQRLVRLRVVNGEDETVVLLDEAELVEVIRNLQADLADLRARQE